MDNDQNTPQAANPIAPATNATAGLKVTGDTTLDTRPAAVATPAGTISHAYDHPAIGDIVDVMHEGEQREAVVLLHASVERLTDLAQRIRDFVGDEARPIVNELMTVAADVRQYL